MWHGVMVAWCYVPRCRCQRRRRRKRRCYDAFVLLAHHDVLQGDRAGREVLVVLPTKYTNRPIKCLIVNQMLVTRSRQDDTWYQQGGGGSRTTTRLWLVPVRIGHAAAASYINMYKAKAAKQITAVSKVSTYKSKKKDGKRLHLLLLYNIPRTWYLIDLVQQYLQQAVDPKDLNSTYIPYNVQACGGVQRPQQHVHRAKLKFKCVGMLLTTVLLPPQVLLL